MDTTATPEGEAPKVRTSYGALIGLLVIVAAIVLGALYFLKERVDMGISSDPAAQSASTEPEAIEADLEAQTADDFDQEIEQAFVEMEAAIEAQ
jgi:hypothetical protein